jgi:hypothetical protein
MPSGGARTRSGPPPDPNAAARERATDKGWLTLPAEGRTTPAPPWPAPTWTDREAELWATMWRKPQSLIWERDGMVEYVAMFVRQLAEAEVEKASAENRKTVRMMFADLYLTADSMARARIKIVADEVTGRRAAEAPTEDPDDPRDRLSAVPDADAG